jgi:hypothetical protein
LGKVRKTNHTGQSLFSFFIDQSDNLSCFHLNCDLYILQELYNTKNLIVIFFFVSRLYVFSIRYKWMTLYYIGAPPPWSLTLDINTYTGHAQYMFVLVSRSIYRETLYMTYYTWCLFLAIWRGCAICVVYVRLYNLHHHTTTIQNIICRPLCDAYIYIQPSASDLWSYLYSCNYNYIYTVHSHRHYIFTIILTTFRRP